MRVLPLLFLLLSACSSAPTPPPTPTPNSMLQTTVVITRHAEKQSGPDPDLSPEGHARAQALSHALLPYRINAVYITTTKRSLQTAAPTIAALGIPSSRVFSLSPSVSPEQLAARVRAHPFGDAILVVSHTNIIPDLLQALHAPGPAFMSESTYDQLYVVALAESGPKLLHAGPLPLPPAPSSPR